jgi:mono/diheme cytochrome c family protein
MLRSLLVFALAAVFAVNVGSSTEPATPPNAPFGKISPANGKEMFAALCASCHGEDGKGHGAVVTEHRVMPIDLTVLSKSRHGVFPKAHVVHVLQFGAEVPSHTSIEMPVWGPILGKINLEVPRDRQLRINNLSSYLESIQVK